MWAISCYDERIKKARFAIPYKYQQVLTLKENSKFWVKTFRQIKITNCEEKTHLPLVMVCHMSTRIRENQNAVIFESTNFMGGLQAMPLLLYQYWESKSPSCRGLHSHVCRTHCHTVPRTMRLNIDCDSVHQGI